MNAIARRHDPETSHLAAEYITTTGKRSMQKRTALAACREWPGCTSFELAEKVGGGLETRYMMARRLPELEHDKLIVRVGSKRCPVTGHLATCWYPLPHQADFLASKEE